MKYQLTSKHTVHGVLLKSLLLVLWLKCMIEMSRVLSNFAGLLCLNFFLRDIIYQNILFDCLYVKSRNGYLSITIRVTDNFYKQKNNWSAQHTVNCCL